VESQSDAMVLHPAAKSLAAIQSGVPDIQALLAAGLRSDVLDEHHQ
jgi:hypothetical protein